MVRRCRKCAGPHSHLSAGGRAREQMLPPAAHHGKDVGGHMAARRGLGQREPGGVELTQNMAESTPSLCGWPQILPDTLCTTWRETPSRSCSAFG